MKWLIQINYQAQDGFGNVYEEVLEVPRYYNIDSIFNELQRIVRDNGHLGVFISPEMSYVLAEHQLTLIN